MYAQNGCRNITDSVNIFYNNKIENARDKMVFVPKNSRHIPTKRRKRGEGGENEQAVRDLSIETFFTCKKKVDGTDAVLSLQMRTEGS